MGFEQHFTLIKQGAEAKLYRGSYLGKPTIVKERFKKSYRHPDLDDYLTKERIKGEARANLRCKMAVSLISGLRTPAIYYVDFETRRIFMEDLHQCVTAKDFITNLQENGSSVENTHTVLGKRLTVLAHEIGKTVGIMHANNIIHGDLTTSNILLNNEGTTVNSLVLIDFGLSYIESNAEDKGVDLYVLERAIISTHQNADLFFQEVVNAYKKQNKKQSADVLKKLEDVRARGRKRTMVG
ncbi:EKC/KEOPS complex subunit TP53RK-like isoform X1 [Schistocerca nitens]|uniref:EKC/KEOPS complex subunit TP53RK-like isoform X1 n=1 Tax=Schistocerca nitens TaxID=7011 RepID=UPI0021178675|nr:EKC/KEOPS complex subunit TP53RK-like isoform X1 [Schistocerca nitens]